MRRANPDNRRRQGVWCCAEFFLPMLSTPHHQCSRFVICSERFARSAGLLAQPGRYAPRKSQYSSSPDSYWRCKTFFPSFPAYSQRRRAVSTNFCWGTRLVNKEGKWIIELTDLLTNSWSGFLEYKMCCSFYIPPIPNDNKLIPTFFMSRLDEKECQDLTRMNAEYQLFRSFPHQKKKKSIPYQMYTM